MPEPAGASKSYSALETQGLARANDFTRVGSAYALEHATRPSTIGFVLASNPIALLAWLVSVFSFILLEWTLQDWGEIPGLDRY